MRFKPRTAATKPLHVAIIMDGNGRWAEARGWPRIEGHRAGAAVVRPLVEAAPNLGIRTLTLFAFSSDNWKRPPSEVSALMRLVREFLDAETSRCCKEGVRLSVLGLRTRLPGTLRRAIASAESATASGKVLNLNIALDYSSRDAILQAAMRLRGAAAISRADFSAALSNPPSRRATPDVDLLIRTGGERRLSDFLLWECAYAELYFTDTMWPDLDAEDLNAAIENYRSRERRFGGTPPAISDRVRGDAGLLAVSGNQDCWLH
ncbi:MAG: di-trans,poly-cis-decaprenylcistransferase [Candidatus Hydrogenedentes bacterium]|nr:di-trans,poly-cis-decaprenylcistransferase [Candidatus Hydrogenedentota bacterium]